MVFASITFLYWFLPAVILLYFLVPKKCKNAILLTASLFFYGWGAPKTLPLLGASILAAYFVGLGIEAIQGKNRQGNLQRTKTESNKDNKIESENRSSNRAERKEEKKTGKGLLWLGVSLELAALLYFKYTDFFIENINRFTGASIPLLHILLPVGISFYTFQLISYMVDVYRGQQKPQKNLIDFAMYICLFSQLVAGPIIRYSDMAGQLKDHQTSWSDGAIGLRRIILGLSKKVLLADILGEFCLELQKTATPSVLFLWLGAIAFALQLYFDFSGYSDMAIGLGRVFGFRFPENFRYPYCADSIRDFWRRWHISLGTWFRDYVYIPLGGSHCSTRKWIRNILVVWLLTGFWHGAEWNFILWGLFFAVLLMLERKVKFPRILILLFFIFSVVLFQETELPLIAGRFAGMFGLRGLPFATVETWYYLRSYGVIFILGIIGATPLCKGLTEKLREQNWGKTVFKIAEPVVLIGLLLLSTAYLVDGTYHPFLYFRF